MGFLMFAYPFYPVVIQRIYAADSLKSIRVGTYSNFIGKLDVNLVRALNPKSTTDCLTSPTFISGPWICTFGGIFRKYASRAIFIFFFV